MIGKYMLGLAICFAGPCAFAQVSDSADPVLAAKVSRAESKGRDLPPVPKGLMEPPPLPPPELHTHDIRKSRTVAKKPVTPAAKKPATPAKSAPATAKKPATTAAKPVTSVAKKPVATAKPAPTAAKKPATTVAKPVAKAPASSAKK